MLHLLDDLCYVFECLALDCNGEAKHALFLLCERLETGDARPGIDAPAVLAVLQRARRDFNDDRMQATGALTGLARRLWGRLLHGAVPD